VPLAAHTEVVAEVLADRDRLVVQVASPVLVEEVVQDWRLLSAAHWHGMLVAVVVVLVVTVQLLMHMRVD
jgi:hypothetical protein